MPPDTIRDSHREEVGLEDSDRTHDSNGIPGDSDERPRPIRAWACAPYDTGAFGSVQPQAFDLGSRGCETRTCPVDIDLRPIKRLAGVALKFGGHECVNLAALRPIAVAISADDRTEAR
jgi:hypothetical protein